MFHPFKYRTLQIIQEAIHNMMNIRRRKMGKRIRWMVNCVYNQQKGISDADRIVYSA